MRFRFSLGVTGYRPTHTLRALAAQSANCAVEFATANEASRECWQLSNDIEVLNSVVAVEFTPKQLLGIGVDPAYAWTGERKRASVEVNC